MNEKEKKLYPIRFLEDSVQEPLGEVSYQIADLGSVDSMVSEGWFGGNSLSELMGTYLERVVGDDSFEYYGLQFPLMVKVIKTTGWQPLQVNVPDEIAAERYDSLGKTALWYVREASPEAALFLGLKRDVDAGDFYRRCQDSTLKDILNQTRPRVGDLIPIRPGTVYAAGPGLTIVEIGECSELTLNIHNWGIGLPDGEDLLLEEAFDLIDFRRFSPAPPSGD
ncbi:MAG: class I mannose-6-phosphate isomerase, partial [Bacteroidales bacterium]|nr:class I mannose-6-phosphate isomerase [Bacteroidales bacterium]